MAREVYEVSLEVVPDGDTDFPDDCEGAFVNVYVTAESLGESLEVAEGVLHDEGYKVIDMDLAVRVELEAYQPHDEDHPSREDLEALLETDDCELGPFHCYESRDDD